jgi:hypothetical protein
MIINKGTNFITSEAGVTYNLDQIESIELLKEKKKFSHWGWWVFWLFVFYPMLLVLLLMGWVRKHYLVCIRGSGTQYLDTFNMMEYDKLVNYIRGSG